MFEIFSLGLKKHFSSFLLWFNDSKFNFGIFSKAKTLLLVCGEIFEISVAFWILEGIPSFNSLKN